MPDALLSGTLSLTQESRGGVAGRAVDSTDSTIAEAQVRATSVEAGIVTAAASSESGVFRLPFLIPGLYLVTGELAGFKKLSLDLVMRLEAGSVTKTREVTGAAPLLKTGTSSMGTIVDQRLRYYHLRHQAITELARFGASSASTLAVARHLLHEMLEHHPQVWTRQNGPRSIKGREV